MRATAIEVTETTALVELRPNWLEWLFGARVVRIALIRPHEQWLTATMWERISHIDHGSAIKFALDFRPPSQLPRAEVRK